MAANYSEDLLSTMRKLTAHPPTSQLLLLHPSTHPAILLFPLFSDDGLHCLLLCDVLGKGKEIKTMNQ